MGTAALFLSITLCTIIASGCRTTKHSTSPADSRVEFSKTPVPSNYDDQDAYAIYQTLLGGTSASSVAVRPIAVLSQTIRHDLCFEPASMNDASMREAATDFVSQNLKTRLITRENMNLKRQIEFISESELERMFSTGPIEGWRAFRQLHPDIPGYVSVSAVGFNRDKTLAMVFVDRYGGPKIGAGGLEVLSKKSGTWKLRGNAALCSWLS